MHGIIEGMKRILHDGVYEQVLRRIPFGSRLLINEFIGSLIADMFKNNISAYGICILTEEVIANTNYNEDIDIDNANPFFFTVYHGSTVPASKHLIQKISVEAIERLVLFDHIIANYDRHRGNLLMNASEDSELIVIDHSHAFGRDVELSSTRIREEMAEAVAGERINLGMVVYDELLNKWLTQQRCGLLMQLTPRMPTSSFLCTDTVIRMRNQIRCLIR